MMFWEFISIFGDLQFWVGAALTSLLFLFMIPKRSRKHVAWFVFLVLPAVIISWMVTQGLKIYFKTPRPCFGLPFCPTTYSFPSGHATVIFAAITVLSLHYRDKRLIFFLFVSACLVAFSRLMLNVHRIEDIIVGPIIGIIVGILVQKSYMNHQREIKEFVSELK